MEELNLGPNDGLIYCMEYLYENFEWLEEKIQNLSCKYLIFDCPGQVRQFQILINFISNFYQILLFILKID